MTSCGGGLASGSILLSNGNLGVSNGGVASSTVISSDGNETVFFGGRIIGSMDSSGGQDVISLGGNASGTMVSSGGYEDISSGGIASGTTVGDGGVQYVSSGGTATGTIVDSGGTEVVVSSGAIGTVVDYGGVIDYPTLPFVSGGVAVVSGGDMLMVTEGSNTYTQQLAGTYTGLYFHELADSGSGTKVRLTSTPCFAEGTRILTQRGEVAVEALRPGDVVVTHLGDPRVITWIGHRRIDLARHADPARVRPIRIAAEAFPENRPHRDLVVSPDHAVFVDGLLIPAKLLVNSASVTVDTECRWVTYYHVELERHDILLAEGLPAESYLDTGNRAMFANAETPLHLHPDFAAAQWQREIHSCAPFACDPARVEPIWRALAERAKTLGWTPPLLATVDDPDLHLLVGTRRIEPLSSRDGRYVFALPSDSTPVRLVSRAASPCEVSPWMDDPRRLGVLVRRLTFRSGTEVRELAMDTPRLDRGWWETEWHASAHAPVCCRWTTGDAYVPVVGTGLLEVTLGGTIRYRIETTRAVGEAAVRPILLHVA